MSAERKMFSIFNHMFRKDETPKTEIIDNVDELTFAQKLEEAVELSSQSLKDATLAMSKTAVETTKMFKTRLELFERKFAVITDSVDDVIIVKTVNRRWISINRFACEIFHLDREKVIGKSNEEIGQEYPKLKPIFDRLDEAEQKAWNERRPTKFRITIEESGRTLYLDIMITPIDNGDNTLQEIVLVGHNNTKFYESVKQGQAAANFLNAISEPILVLNTYGRVSFCNTSFEKTFDLNFIDIAGQLYYNVMTKDFSRALSPCFAEHEHGAVPAKVTVSVGEFELDISPIINDHIYTPVYFMIRCRKKSDSAEVA